MDTVREETWPVGARRQQQQTSAPQPSPLLPPLQNGRIDLRELKSQMEKRLGPDRSRRYFSYFNDYMSQRLSKSDFDKLCLLTLGEENRQLHIRLILSVLYNAYQAKCPPPPDAGRPVAPSAKHVSQATEAFSACNGDARLLQVQGLRPMGTTQVHPLKDQMNNMVPNSRSGAAINHTQVVRGVSTAPENGTVSSLELKRPVHFQQCEPAEPLAKHPRVEQLPPDNMLLQRISMSGAAGHSKELLKSPVRAPLGIPFCSASVGGARKSLPPPMSAGEDRFTNCLEHGGLFNTELLHRRMEKTAETLGLAGVTMDCAELLNICLDKYMKNLIRSSVELVGGSVQSNSRKGIPYKQQAYEKQINGVRLPSHVHLQSGSGPSGATSDIISNHLISINDFKVAMQLNPQQLGEDWPVLLEKICLCSPEEND
ncbi:hypothetical protein QOZ80_4AG0300960 [Eleusine coracana subsp. coracana]|nr:hypothetical protein QOZ80_4AG0300960 [Eleusine coracana subsp. coracana]